jgi:hypothetical protein
MEAGLGTPRSLYGAPLLHRRRSSESSRFSRESERDFVERMEAFVFPLDDIKTFLYWGISEYFFAIA